MLNAQQANHDLQTVV